MPSSVHIDGFNVRFLNEREICEIGEADDVFVKNDDLYVLTTGRAGKLTANQRRRLETDGD